MLTLNNDIPPKLIDGYLRYVAHTLYTKNAPPIGMESWLISATHLDDAHANEVYYPATNIWGAPDNTYMPIVLSCSDSTQSKIASLSMESTLTCTPRYQLRYKNTLGEKLHDPEITHAGETKPLSEWATIVGLCARHMSVRYKTYLAKQETVEWLLRPKGQHSTSLGKYK